MSRSIVNYSGPLIIIDNKVLANYTKKMNTCSNKECKCHAKVSKNNFCPECGSQIKEIEVNLNIPIPNFINKFLGDLSDYVSFLPMMNREQPFVVVVEECYFVSYAGTIISSNKINDCVNKSKLNKNYIRILEILNEAKIPYLIENTTVLIVS